MCVGIGVSAHVGSGSGGLGVLASDALSEEGEAVAGAVGSAESDADGDALVVATLVRELLVVAGSDLDEVGLRAVHAVLLNAQQRSMNKPLVPLPKLFLQLIQACMWATRPIYIGRAIYMLWVRCRDGFRLQEV